MQQIEAKLGVLIDRQTEQRVQLPVLTETGRSTACVRHD